MKAVEFESNVGPGGQIAVPPEVASEIPTGEQLRVVIMWGESDSGQGWRAAGRERFDAAYSTEDVVYEQLMDDSAIR